MEDFVRIIIVVAMLVGLFLLFRAIVLWYWRISEICDTLDSILVELKKVTANTAQTEK